MIIQPIRKLARWLRQKKRVNGDCPAEVIERSQHPISRSAMSQNAVRVLNRLRKSGFEAYLVGGAVRDLLLGLSAKDYDIVTDAKPNQIKRLFSNCRLIGRRFRLAHIYFHHEVIEVATFRAAQGRQASAQVEHDQQGMIVQDNVYGTLEDDVWRRDFTVNAIYYNIKDFSLVDYTGGVADTAARTLRMIGSPEQRYQEDPVRMLRAIRLSAKLDFEIAEETAAPIHSLAHLLAQVPAARHFVEFVKVVKSGAAKQAIALLHEYQLMQYWFPDLVAYFEHCGDDHWIHAFIAQGLENTDQRVREGKSVTPAFFVAVMLWSVFLARLNELAADLALPTHHSMVLFPAMDEVLLRQRQCIALPKRVTSRVKDIWAMQQRLARMKPRSIWHTFHHLSFRAAYDFLLLRAAHDERLTTLADFWQAFVEAPGDTERKRLIDQVKQQQ